MLVTSERKRQLGRQDNIEIDLKEGGCEGVGWIQLIQNRNRCGVAVSTVVKITIQKTWNFNFMSDCYLKKGLTYSVIS
jgi:hypothetical protein